MAEYWEIIPVHIIKEIITVMLRKLLYDSSSPDVRAHVVKGLIIMLESNQTHVLLEKMIPLTNKIIHDPHEKVPMKRQLYCYYIVILILFSSPHFKLILPPQVRAEYISLLIKIQTLKVSKLWEVRRLKSKNSVF